MQSSLADPNWLLSSLAQSAAAVVAIVAGFIMTRIFALASERGGLLSRLKEIRATLHLKNNQRKSIVDRMHALDAREALYKATRRERFYAPLVKEERSLARDCELLEAEIGRLSRRLNTLARPQGLRSGLWASAYFSASGIVLPLRLMPAPTDLFVRALSIRWRSYTVNLPIFKWLVLAAFLSGFVWLIGYVIYAARSLSTADQDLLDARNGEGGLISTEAERDRTAIAGLTATE